VLAIVEGVLSKPMRESRVNRNKNWPSCSRQAPELVGLLLVVTRG